MRWRDRLLETLLGIRLCLDDQLRDQKKQTTNMVRTKERTIAIKRQHSTDFGIPQNSKVITGRIFEGKSIRINEKVKTLPVQRLVGVTGDHIVVWPHLN